MKEFVFCVSLENGFAADHRLPQNAHYSERKANLLLSFGNQFSREQDMENIPEDWLEEINRRLSDAGVPYKQRPWHAMRAWSLERNIGVCFPSPTSEHIFGWFYRNSPPEAHHIG